MRRSRFEPSVQAEGVTISDHGPEVRWNVGIQQEIAHPKLSGRLNEGLRLKSVSTSSSVSKPRTLAHAAINSWPVRGAESGETCAFANDDLFHIIVKRHASGGCLGEESSFDFRL